MESAADGRMEEMDTISSAPQTDNVSLPTTSNHLENSIVWIEADAAMKCFVFSEAYLQKHLFADM
jgi:hypothetical protein